MVSGSVIYLTSSLDDISNDFDDNYVSKSSVESYKMGGFCRYTKRNGW